MSNYTAKFVRDMPAQVGVTKMYKCDPPVSYKKYGVQHTTEHVVIVSWKSLCWTDSIVLPCDEAGRQDSYGRVQPACWYPTLDHTEILKSLGYALQTQKRAASNDQNAPAKDKSSNENP